MDESEYERAELIAERQREAAIMAARMRLMPGQIIERSGQRICIDCDEEIEARRLVAAPHSGRCASCQHDHELRQRSRGAA